MITMQHELGPLQAIQHGKLCDIVDCEGTDIAVDMRPADAELLVHHHNNYTRVLVLNRELREALEKFDLAFADWQVGQIPGRPEDILALISQVRSTLAKADKESS